MRLPWTAAVLALVCGCAGAQGSPRMHPVDCYDYAASYHQVNPWVLRAIAVQESSERPAATAHNTDGSVDRGITGINSVHLPELARYGISANELYEPCKSIYISAWLLRRHISRYGNSCRAIGAYHSKTRVLNEAYVRRIRRILARWSIALEC